MSSSLYSCKVGLGGALSVFCAVEVGKQGDGLASRGHQVGTAVSGMTPSVCHSLSLVYIQLWGQGGGVWRSVCCEVCMGNIKKRVGVGGSRRCQRGCRLSLY